MVTKANLTAQGVWRRVWGIGKAPHEHHMSQPTEKMMNALQHYLVNQNKTAAYRHAYDCEDMSARTVNREAIRIFKNPVLLTTLQTMQAQAAANCQVSVEWVLHRAKLLADFSINKFMYIDEAGAGFYDFSNATDDDWYCISEYCVDIVQKGAGMDKYEAERVKFKGESRIAALRLVGEHVKVQAFKQQIEHTGHVLNMDTKQYKKARQEMLADDDC